MIHRIGVPFLLSVLMLVPAASSDEPTILNEVSTDNLEAHAREIIQYVRPGGSPGESAAIDYIVETLDADGIPVEVMEFSAYVSDPVSCEAKLKTQDAEPITCLTQALAKPTDDGGSSGWLVDCGKGTVADYRGVDVKGKFALVEALAYPWSIDAAEKAGAAAVVFSSPTDKLHELTVSTIWGTPTHKNYQRLPGIPSIAINKKDGNALRAKLRSEPVEFWLETEVDSGFKPLRLPIASIASEKDPDGFVLLGGHIDAWHHGANDEGASNAAILELARIFYRHRDELERSLKVAWWPAHSNGRYAGSTWYADSAWLDLRQNALAYMNVDGLGQMGTSRYEVWSTAEMDQLARSVLEDVANVELEPDRPVRNSDQSFYAVGLPLLQFHQRRSEGGAGYWWWHTPEDTIDKVDFEVLTEATRVYASALWRLMSSPTPPMDLPAVTRELRELLEERQRLAGEHLDLSRALERTDELHGLMLGLEKSLRSKAPSASSPEVARSLVRIVRPLIRVRYQERGPYHQDPAVSIPTLPGLAAVESIGELDPSSDLYGFTRTYLKRELNRLMDHIDQSIAEAEVLQRRLQ